MLDMAWLKDIWKRGNRKLVLSCCMVGILTLSGCDNIVADGIADLPFSGTLADYFKPDVNRDKHLVIDPYLVTYDFDDGTRNIWKDSDGNIFEDPDDPEPGPGVPEEPITPTPTPPQKGNWVRTADPKGFKAPTNWVISADVYGDYLTEQVYLPINNIIRGTQNDEGGPIHDDIYFLVSHTGYDWKRTRVVNEQGVSVNKMSAVPTTSSTCRIGEYNSKISEVYSGCHIPYMLEWVGNLDINKGNAEARRTYFLKKLSELGKDKEYSSALSGPVSSITKEQEEAIHKKYKMNLIGAWRRFGTKYSSFSAFCNAVDANETDVQPLWEAVPNLNVKVYNKASAPLNLNLNYLQSSKTDFERYPVREVSKLSETYNQFEKRVREPQCRMTLNGSQLNGAYTSKNVSGEPTGYLLSYLDGYHRTVIYITIGGKDSATIQTAESLRSSFSSDWSQVETILKGVKAPGYATKEAAQAALREMFPDFTEDKIVDSIIPAGVDGIGIR